MTDDDKITTRSVEFTAVTPISWPARRKWWQWLRDVILRRPKPQPVYPEGTRSVVLDYTDGTNKVRVYYPAVMINEVDS